MPAASQAAPILVWALPLRLAHWSLVALLLFNSLNDGGRTHRYAGYVATGIVLLRLLWGRRVRATHPARWRLPAAPECLEHLGHMRRGHVPTPAGHSALGALMACVLWSLILLLGLSGWISQWDRYWGEAWIERLHQAGAYLLYACIGLHLLGVLISSRLERQNLALAMISGRKRVDAQARPAARD